MKILSRQQFLNLPEGVLYCVNRTKEEVGFSDLKIKGETLSNNNDWFEICLTCYEHHDTGELIERHDDMLKGVSYPLEISQCRNGLFEDDNIFLVYEKKDLSQLIEMLNHCVGADDEKIN